MIFIEYFELDYGKHGRIGNSDKTSDENGPR